MAASCTSKGYQCQFLDSVPEDLYCKQCSLVARKLTITSCCGESYCNACIHSVQQAKKPCPECAHEKFEIYVHVKLQKKILSLQVFCPLKEKGCGWSGRLEQQDAHLHEDCDLTNVQCPLNCEEKIARKDITHHTANECAKRDYICPYCSFKAVYEIVVNIHWLECTYYPLPCPNRCGVTCERPTMEEHIKICPLQEVECEFQHAGCEAKFRREDEEEHMREKSQTHLTMMTTASLKTYQEVRSMIHEQEKMIEKTLEQEKRLKEQSEQLKKQEKALAEQDKQIQEQKRKLEGHAKNFEKHNKRQIKELEKLEKKLQDKFLEELKYRLAEQKKEHEIKLEKHEEKLAIQMGKLQEALIKKMQVLEEMCLPIREFTMKNFSTEKAKSRFSDWKSPAMFTHLGGYKFCIGIDANGAGNTCGKGINVELWAMKGVYDDQLEWPAKAQFTIELINHYPMGENKKASTIAKWDRPNQIYNIIGLGAGGIFHNDPRREYLFIEHSELHRNSLTQTHYLKDDTLYFVVSEVNITS